MQYRHKLPALLISTLLSVTVFACEDSATPTIDHSNDPAIWFLLVGVITNCIIALATIVMNLRGLFVRPTFWASSVMSILAIYFSSQWYFHCLQSACNSLEIPNSIVVFILNCWLFWRMLNPITPISKPE